ncbi:MAG: DUF72 domain-containing protein [Candidatus Kapabacteria bacterium]|nr:DUF72 domain-containing protein [Candidatus Kapabacteria bacterium]MCS7169991.1 DUF72 domain-containing protein [Candidatus Kapabacteria bacterium]MDW7996960.1 DUF72 domain-containing protein [Bacteroidota bacterium]MDW8224965.1 DUF72 domain-containing protein [Bacteroidota bacterium]
MSRAVAEGSSPDTGAPLYYVGTSGWAYREWRSRWYPRKLPTREWLRFYAQHFPTVELNSTFYRLPPPERFQFWKHSVPKTFRFAVKAPRLITHGRQLHADGELLHTFMQAISLLGAQLGPVLWQFPPQYACAIELLRAFLPMLPPTVEHAFEFRHPSWDNSEVWHLLRSAGIALVWSSSLRYPCFRNQTAPFLYVRFHGLKGGYAHQYTDDELQPWAELLADAIRRGCRAYVYFNNTAGTAPQDALHFRELLEARL